MKIYELVLNLFKDELKRRGFDILIKSTNVKMHKLLSYINDNFEETEGVQLFDRICECEYDSFINLLDSEDLTRYYIGSTSSFYILPCKYEDTIRSVIDSFNGSYGPGNTFIEKLAIEILDYEGIGEDDANKEIVESINIYLHDEGFDNLKEKIENFINELVNDWFEDINIKEIKSVHEYIENIKNCNCKTLVECYL